MRATSGPASGGACAAHNSTYAAACRLEFLTSKQREVEVLLSTCNADENWEPLEYTPGPRCLMCGPSLDGARVEHGPTPQTMELITPSRVRLERCTRQSMHSLADGGDPRWNWEVHRIGPFNTTGGNDWVRGCDWQSNVAPSPPSLIHLPDPLQTSRVRSSARADARALARARIAPCTWHATRHQ